MKKKLLIIATVLLLLCGCNKKDEEKEEKYLKTINYTQLKQKIDKKDTFILVITRTDCSHCAEYLPILKNVLEKYKVTAYKVEIDNFTKEEKNALIEICNVKGTPQTVFIIDGAEKNTSSRIDGYVGSTTIINRLKAEGYIKEDEE